MPTILEDARAIANEIIALRRDFHQHPEIGFEELRTGEKIAQYCEKLGLNVRRAAKTGVIADLNKGNSGSVLAFRADIDALPVQEENEITYRSRTPGRGHLCGHDAHTAMLLGAAKLLVRHAERLKRPVRLIFQPAEEVINGGAELLIKENVLDGVGEIYGLHVTPQLATGTLGTRVGPLMASMDRVDIAIEGTGGHGAFPHRCHDPVLAGAEIVQALQSIVSRRVDPLEPAVLSITQFHAGDAFNVIPARAQLAGTARSLSPNVRKNLPVWIQEIASGAAAAHGTRAGSKFTFGTPVLVNERDSVERVREAFGALDGKVVEAGPMMGGEDFAFYLEKVPGAFAFLGAGDGTPATAQGFHHPRYNIDEKALAWGAAFFVQLALER